ncbi:hypothetical protein Y1Q_0014106 [Alligator mississippiensis]|uniref:Uncharacterized protein n=1 Tax=Alligator mississippiensis TaxID=8496 RepID=A0A151MJV7_ALLMI|nr:hypothetical protein Y1Q_0014106 [Alligator mississippiensis]
MGIETGATVGIGGGARPGEYPQVLPLAAVALSERRVLDQLQLYIGAACEPCGLHSLFPWHLLSYGRARCPFDLNLPKNREQHVKPAKNHRGEKCSTTGKAEEGSFKIPAGSCDKS